VPVLVMHGTEDRILPFESTGKRLPDLVANLTLIPVEGGPHNTGWTHPDECNKALLDFLADDHPNAHPDSAVEVATRTA
jgi:non-heme chloroperoxidase